MQAQDLAGAMLLYDDINKKGFEGDMVLNGFAEFIRNLLICKDERVISLLEVVESFRKKYQETAQKSEAAYLISALNIINETEINYKAARNKRLHVELALIKLCYLSQALQLTTNGSSVDKKKLTEAAKPLAYRILQPIASSAKVNTSNKPAPAPKSEAKLIIETREELKPAGSAPELPQPPLIVEEKNASYNQPAKPANGKLRSLEAIRQRINDSNQNAVPDKPLQQEELENGWKKFLENLKQTKNPAWQGFAAAKLFVKDDHSFDAVVSNNINQKFLELERSSASEFLKKEVANRKLKFTITLVPDENPEVIETDAPLSAKQQYFKLVEEYPLVKELKDRLRLELDY